MTLGELLLEQQRRCWRDVLEEARRRARRRAPHCRPPWRADCRRRSSRACRPSCPWPPRRWRGRRRAGSRRRALGERHDVGRRRRSIHSANSLPVRPMPVWISSKISSRPCSSQSCAQRPQELAAARRGRRLRPGSARSGSPRSPGRSRASTASRSPNGTWSKPSTFGPKPSRYFLLPAGGERRQRAAVERALEGDDAEALGLAVHDMVLARRLDRAFDRLGAGIARRRRGRRRSPRTAARPAARLPGIRKMLETCQSLSACSFSACDEMRMRMAERVDRDAGREIEIALAVGRDQPGALAALEGEIDARIGRQKMRCPRRSTHRPEDAAAENEMCRPAGGTMQAFYCRRRRCQHAATRGCPSAQMSRCDTCAAKRVNASNTAGTCGRDGSATLAR